jgi:two-component system chemotaxis response regulator CheB
MIRVLIVDDSPTLRHLVRAILESDPELHVVGEARNSEEAVDLTRKLQPDIITMDIRMPQADGYQAIRRIMAESPRPILVLASAKSDLEPTSSMKALEAGALMVVGKPHGLPGADPEADQLIAQVKAMAEVKVVRRRWWLLGEKSAPRRGEPAEPPRGEPVEPGQSKPVVTTPRPAPGPVHLIAIGASTGGPPALQIIFGQLPIPTGLSVPVVVVQHISQGFVDGLARWLDETTPLRIKVAEDGEPLRPGTVYMAPDDQHLLVTQGDRARLKSSPPVDGHRPSVTVLFESVAQNYGSATVGVLLTGMGDDGARGLKALHDAGGRTIAQDKATSVIFGMPQRGIVLGVAHEVLPLEQIAPRLAELVRRGDERTR